MTSSRMPSCGEQRACALEDRRCGAEGGTSAGLS
eukprot:CAMPEP_0176155108 /NCGR_PEP_ID=MMETSP0120_2-20121206/79250_1 /TAXON_ID=160619 /ORGANISM="Kryptoperidinium foliaceum, Strain CCMP 1326" /LENGTH=33 /DNA_ID= /DNA_START= /DNA_END= /DNA_ORIENTATION=